MRPPRIGGGLAGSGGSCGSRSFCIAEMFVALLSRDGRVGASCGSAPGGSACPAPTPRDLLAFSPLESSHGHEGGQAFVVVVEGWAGGCPVSNRNDVPVFLSSVADGGRSRGGWPCGRAAPTTKVPLCDRVGWLWRLRTYLSP